MQTTKLTAEFQQTHQAYSVLVQKYPQVDPASGMDRVMIGVTLINDGMVAVLTEETSKTQVFFGIKDARELISTLEAAVRMAEANDIADASLVGIL